LLDVFTESLLDQEPIIVIGQVSIESYLLHMTVFGVVNYEKQQTVVICVVYKLQKRSKILLIMYVELTMNLHVHRISLYQLHYLLHFGVFSATGVFQGFCNTFLHDRCFRKSFEWCLCRRHCVAFSANAPSGLGLCELPLFVDSFEYGLVHDFIGDSQITP